VYLCSFTKIPKGIFIFLAIASTAILPPLLFSLLRLIDSFDYRFEGTHFYPLSYFILAMVISFLGYVAVLIRTTIKEIELSLQNEYEIGANKEQIVALEISRITNICAKYIHGNLQSSLITLSKNLEVAMENQDAPKVDSLISQILEILRDPEVDLERKVNNIHLEIRARVALWSGLVEIHQNVSVPESRLPSSLVIQISDCVEEAISNAVRHGKASAIQIALYERPEGRIVLTISDNGILSPDPIGGLGFRIYQEASNSNWSIKRDEANNLTVIEILFNV
jgi:signal transduction histidine kinase